MSFADHRSVRVGFWTVLFLSVFAWAPTTYPGYWQALEGFVPVFNVAGTAPLASVASDPDVWRSTGSAAYLLVQPLLLLGMSPTAAVRTHFALTLLLGSLGTYAWLRVRFDDRTAGLAGVIYLFLPIVLSTIYIRGSAGDAMILALLPLGLAVAAAYSAGQSLAVAGLLVINIVWMWRAQAGLALFATILLLGYALLAERHRLTALVVAVAGLAGFASLIPLLGVRAPAPVTFQEHFVYLHQFFATGWQTAPSVPGWQDGYPFQLGTTAVAFSLVGLWLWQRNLDPGTDRGRHARYLWFLYGALGLLLILTLTISAPLWQLTRAERFLSYPWQLLLPAAPLLAATAGLLVAMNRSLRRIPLWVALVLLTVLSSYPYLTAAYTDVIPSERPEALIGAEANLAVLATDLLETGDGATTLTVTWQLLRPLAFDYNVFFQAVSETDDGVAVVAQLDRPPLDEDAPPTTWRPGQVYRAEYRLDMDEGAPGPLTYYFGYYDWRDGRRLPVNGGITDKMVFYGR